VEFAPWKEAGHAVFSRSTGDVQLRSLPAFPREAPGDAVLKVVWMSWMPQADSAGD